MADRLPADLEGAYLRDHIPAAWTDGGTWNIEQGKDFDIKLDGMRRRLRREAFRLHCSVAIRREGNRLTFRFHNGSGRARM